MAKTVHNNMCSNKSWNAVDFKDTKIIALRAEINNFREELKKAKETDKKDSASGVPNYAIE